MTESSLTILPETEGDAPAIERLHERTFGPGRYAKTAYRLRERVAHSIDLSFTARVGTLLVGSVRLSPVRIGETKALLLGPLTVEPPFRERGVGQALIARACSAGPCHHAGAGRSGTDFGRRTGRWRLRRRFGTDPGGIARRAGLRPELEKRRQFLHLRAEPAQNCQPPRLLLAN